MERRHGARIMPQGERSVPLKATPELCLQQLLFITCRAVLYVHGINILHGFSQPHTYFGLEANHVLDILCGILRHLCLSSQAIQCNRYRTLHGILSIVCVNCPELMQAMQGRAFPCTAGAGVL